MKFAFLTNIFSFLILFSVILPSVGFSAGDTEISHIHTVYSEYLTTDSGSHFSDFSHIDTWADEVEMHKECLDVYENYSETACESLTFSNPGSSVSLYNPAHSPHHFAQPADLADSENAGSIYDFGIEDAQSAVSVREDLQ